MLRTKDVTKRFGGLQALSRVSLGVDEGEFVGLIGPNGSGKTTLINCISGLLKPEGGRVWFKGQAITGLQAHRIFHLGIGRTFQISKVFGRLDVMSNLRVPALTEGRMSPQQIVDRAREILGDINLNHLAQMPADQLSGGQRKLLEVGMIMMTDPELLLLDEPFGGIHPELKSHLEGYLHQLNQRGKTIVLVSHEMASIFRMCRRLVVLDHGRIIADGDPKVVREDDRVINAYLGGRDAA